MGEKPLAFRKTAKLTGWHKSTIYRKIEDKTFPAPVKYEFSFRCPEESDFQWKSRPITQHDE